MNEGSRRAEPGDLPVLEALAELAADEMSPLRGGSVWSRREARRPPLAEGFRADLADRDARVAVGTIDGTVVGYGAIRVEPLHDGASIGRIGDIYVMPGARGVGVGESIANHLMGWAAARGCVGVDSLALPGDRHTKNFFETHGLVARAIIVHRKLDPEPVTRPGP